MVAAGAIWSFPLLVTKQAFADASSTEDIDEDRSVLGYDLYEVSLICGCGRALWELDWTGQDAEQYG